MQFLLIFFCVFVYLLIYVVTKSWLSVARLSSIIWIIEIIGCCAFLTSDLYGDGIIYILITIFLFAIGEFLGQKIKTRKNNMEVREFDSTIKNIAWSLLILFIVLALTRVVILIYRGRFQY